VVIPLRERPSCWSGEHEKTTAVKAYYITEKSPMSAVLAHATSAAVVGVTVVGALVVTIAAACILAVAGCMLSLQKIALFALRGGVHAGS